MACINSTADYAELKRLLTQAGVFRPQLVYYGLQALLVLAIFVLGFGLLFVADAFWMRLLIAGLLTLGYVRVAYIIHDAGHRQLFGQPRQNDIAMLVGGFFVGTSRSWWFETHNQHHANANDPDRDPNMALPVLAFTDEQARSRRSIFRIASRYQAYYFYGLLFLEGLGVRVASAQFLLSGRAKYTLIEASTIAAHLVLYGAVVLATMPLAQAVAFMLVHQCLTGFYMGFVFAPNHKGMPILDRTLGYDFFQSQVLSCRNIHPSPITDFAYGYLNYQIGHHLFPMIPRNRLGVARLILRDYCAQHAATYHETSIWQSYVEVTRYFNDVVAPLRGPAERPLAYAASPDSRPLD
ncbi:MAG: acyl-CoA desaturase [Gemmatimonadales bacterium]|nr:MAG: acyl-CoA desaturase [Gemmatimonadales bacterium]